MKKIATILLPLLLLGGIYMGRKIYFTPDYGSGEVAPDFTGTKPDGGTFQLSDLRGYYILLEFWGSWCADCRESHPGLVELYKEYNSYTYKDAKGFEVVSVGLETHEGRWKRAIERDGLVWVHHTAQFAEKSAAMFDQPLALDYGIRWAPTSFLIAPDGRIIAVNPSKADLKDFLESNKV